MAYRGTTAGSSVSNVPFRIAGGQWGARSTDVLPSSVGGQSLWFYNTTDGSSEIIAATYFTDGFYLGMKQGDVILGAATTGSSVSVYFGVISAVTTDGCGIASTGGMVGSS